MRWADVEHSFQDANNRRARHSGDWQSIARFVAPSRLPDTWKDSEDDPMTHTVVDTTAVSANQRLSSILYQYAFPANMPWSIPRLQGREPSREEALWLDHVRDAMHHWFMVQSKTFQRMASETMMDITAFGTGSSYTWSKPYQLPEYRSVSIFKASFLQDESGANTHYFYEGSTNLAAAKQDYPAVALPDGNAGDKIPVVYAVVPSRSKGGRYKFTESVFVGDEHHTARTRPLRDMPGHTPTYMRRPQDDYGYGPGHIVYPFARWLNEIQESTLAGVQKSIDPPLFDFTGGAFKKFDRRVGRVNIADWAALGFSDVREAIQPLAPSGDLRPGIEIVKDIRQAIYLGYNIDWLQHDGMGVRTATEVSDMRSLRMQSLASLTSRLKPEWITGLVEMTFSKLRDADYFDDMPPSLDQTELVFEYRSPLASLIDQAENDIIMSYAQKLTVLETLQPGVKRNFDSDAAARRMAQNDGLPEELLRPLDVVVAERDAERDQAVQAAELEAQQMGAAAMRDAGQGAASVAGALSDV